MIARLIRQARMQANGYTRHRAKLHTLPMAFSLVANGRSMTRTPKRRAIGRIGAMNCALCSREIPRILPEVEQVRDVAFRSLIHARDVSEQTLVIRCNSNLFQLEPVYDLSKHSVEGGRERTSSMYVHTGALTTTSLI